MIQMMMETMVVTTAKMAAENSRNIDDDPGLDVFRQALHNKPSHISSILHFSCS